MPSWKFHLQLMEKYCNKPLREHRAQQRKAGKKIVPPPPVKTNSNGEWSWL